ncbi:MAG: hypothetical protein JKX91_03525 [Rhizobiaceae bacterium]|nr:hypothetical protein [Rhizobiaceae bacterium]
MKTDGSQMEQLTHDDRVNWFPHFPPDGSIVAFISFPTDTIGHPANKDVLIRTMNPDGSNQVDLDSFQADRALSMSIHALPTASILLTSPIP